MENCWCIMGTSCTSSTRIGYSQVGSTPKGAGPLLCLDNEEANKGGVR